MEQSREISSTLPLHFGVVAIEKGAFGLPLTIVSQLTCLPPEQFEEYGWDNQIGAWAWRDLPIDWIGSLWLPVESSKG